MKTNTLKITLIAGMVGLLACAGPLAPAASAQEDEEETVLDFAGGGGWIVGTPSGAKGSFGVSGGVATNAVEATTFLFGNLEYVDHATGMEVSSTNLTAFLVVDSQTRQLEFAVEIDGVAGVATVIVSDQGEPGRNDTFSLSLSTGYSASGLLGGGQRGGGNLRVKSE